MRSNKITIIGSGAGGYMLRLYTRKGKETIFSDYGT